MYSGMSKMFINAMIAVVTANGSTSPSNEIFKALSLLSVFTKRPKHLFQG